jgi:Protein of unknown function (DUF3109)
LALYLRITKNYGTMFVVENVLLSDDIAEVSFACNLGACFGACCVQGDEGAPLTQAECRELEAILPKVQHLLSEEALAVIAAQGVWERTESGNLATTCVNGGSCVFVHQENNVSKCAIQQVYHQGEITFEKPLSCHLYPIRVKNYAGHEVLNYEQIPICSSGILNGTSTGTLLYQYLKTPLIRKYGKDWYQALEDTIIQMKNPPQNR